MDESRMVVDDTTITSHIKRIRKKFMQLDDDFDRIETVYGMGYRWKSQWCPLLWVELQFDDLFWALREN